MVRRLPPVSGFVRAARSALGRNITIPSPARIPGALRDRFAALVSPVRTTCVSIWGDFRQAYRFEQSESPQEGCRALLLGVRVAWGEIEIRWYMFRHGNDVIPPMPPFVVAMVECQAAPGPDLTAEDRRLLEAESAKISVAMVKALLSTPQDLPVILDTMRSFLALEARLRPDSPIAKWHQEGRLLYTVAEQLAAALEAGDETRIPPLVAQFVGLGGGDLLARSEEPRVRAALLLAGAGNKPPNRA